MTIQAIPTDYACELTLEAPASAVHAAIRSPDAWWWTDADVGTGAGELIRFRWAPSQHLELRIDEDVPDRLVEWTCVRQHDTNLPRPDEWLGSRLCFRLEEAGGRTRLSFVHRGLHPRLECFGTCEAGWERLLRHSLRALVETGRGLPLGPPA